MAALVAARDAAERLRDPLDVVDGERRIVERQGLRRGDLVGDVEDLALVLPEAHGGELLEAGFGAEVAEAGLADLRRVADTAHLVDAHDAAVVEFERALALEKLLPNRPAALSKTPSSRSSVMPRQLTLRSTRERSPPGRWRIARGGHQSPSGDLGTLRAGVRTAESRRPICRGPLHSR
jgi:hypothetical protein